MLKSGKTRSKIYIGYNIEYDVNSSQVKVTIVKRTKIRVKVLPVNLLQKNRWHDQKVCYAMKQTYGKIND